MDVEFVVGEKLPFPLNGAGMRLAINPTDNDNGLEILFFILMPNIRLEEEMELKSHPIRIGILLSPPLVFLLLIVDKIKLDAPFAVGAYDPKFQPQLLACANEPRKWSPSTRRPVKVIIVDETTQIIKHLRYMTLTQSWWVQLADAFELCPKTLSKEEYKAAMTRAYKQWQSTAEMIPACLIVERLMLYTRFASPVFTVALAIPMVRMNESIRAFCSAKTCSTLDRTFDLALFARPPAWGVPSASCDECG